MGRHAGRSVASRRDGRRRRRAPTATWVSRRASAAPRQTWTPAPKATWPRSRRRTSNRSGSAKRAGSRFAAPSRRTTSAPRRNRLAGQLDVRLGDPPGPLDRALPAHGLLDRRRQEPRRLAKARERVGVLEQRPDRGADQADRGLRPGHQQQDDHRDQLGVAQEAVLVRRLDERAHEVGCGLGPSRGDQLADIAAEDAPGRLPLGDERPVLGDREGVETSRHRGRPGGARPAGAPRGSRGARR